jgi:hypothetical protein
LHKARHPTNLHDDEMTKRAFWSLYNLDRLIASTLGRPLGIADEDITVSLPRELNDDGTETPGTSSMTIPIQVIKLRRIFSRIYRYCKPSLPNAPNSTALLKNLMPTVYSTNQPPPNPTELSINLRHFRQELDEWRSTSPVYPPALLYSTSYFDYLHATTLLLLYRPSPRNPTPDQTSIISCGNASIAVIRSYWESYCAGKLKWIWLTLSQLYFAGITILWCLNRNFHSVNEGLGPVWEPDELMMRRAIQAVVVILEAFGKRRAGVDKLAETFRAQSTTIFSHLAYQQRQQQAMVPPPVPQPQPVVNPVYMAPPVPLAPVLDDVLLVDASRTMPVMDPQMTEQLFYSYDWFQEEMATYYTL